MRLGQAIEIVVIVLRDVVERIGYFRQIAVAIVLELGCRAGFV